MIEWVVIREEVYVSGRGRIIEVEVSVRSSLVITKEEVSVNVKR